MIMTRHHLVDDHSDFFLIDIIFDPRTKMTVGAIWRSATQATRTTPPTTNHAKPTVQDNIQNEGLAQVDACIDSGGCFDYLYC